MIPALSLSLSLLLRALSCRMRLSADEARLSVRPEVFRVLMPPLLVDSLGLLADDPTQLHLITLLSYQRQIPSHGARTIKIDKFYSEDFPSRLSRHFNLKNYSNSDSAIKRQANCPQCSPCCNRAGRRLPLLVMREQFAQKTQIPEISRAKILNTFRHHKESY